MGDEEGFQIHILSQQSWQLVTSGQGHCSARTEHCESVFLASFLRFPGVTTSIRLHNMHHLLPLMITPWPSQKIEVITFYAEWTLLNFLGGSEAGYFHCLLCIFDSWSKCYTQAWSSVPTRSKTSSGSSSLRDTRHREILNQVLFWSSINIRCLYLAKTFDIPNISATIHCTDPKHMSTSLAMPRTSRPLSHITRVFTTLTFLSAVVSLGQPDRPSSSMLSLSLPLKLCCPFFHCAIRRRLFLQDFHEVFMNPLGGIPFLEKYLVTALI